MTYGWTKDMDDILRRFAKDGKSFSDVAKTLGVSRSAVGGRAYRLGVHFKAQKSRPWNFHDLAFLQDHHHHMTHREIGQRLGRHETEICRKATSLGLRKYKVSA